MDALSIVVDEVALEGLDGITIPSLWMRLKDTQPRFPLKLDDCTKEYIWKSLISNAELNFYELPQERDDVLLFDRYKIIDPETGIESATTVKSDAKKEIYPIHIIPDNKDGIQGSCALFSERIDITKHVRSKTLTSLINLEGALERYGRKLVVVASQALRFRALIGFGSDPDLKLTNESYCLLERVGRARWQGELQSDLHGSSFKIDARKLHYTRKSLVRHGLVGMQSYVVRMKAGQQQQHSILLQLKRFYIYRRSKYDILMETLSNFLQQSPGQFSTMIQLREQLNINDFSLKRLIAYMRSAKLVQHCKYPLEDLDPSAGPCINRNGNKVLVRCLRLLKPYTRKGVADDDDDDEEEEEEEENDTVGRKDVSTEGRIMEKDVLSQAYHLVLSCGTKGISQSAIGFRMNIGKLESRMLCRTLEREGLIKGFLEDEGRQRTTKFISHRCVGGSDHLHLLAQEQERKKFLNSSPDTVPATPKTPSTSGPTARENARTSAAKKKSARRADKDAEETPQICDDKHLDTGGEGLDGDGDGGKTRGRRKTAGKRGSMTAERTQAGDPIIQPVPAECEAPAQSESINSTTPDTEFDPKGAAVEDEELTSSAPASSQNEALNTADKPADGNVVVVKDVDQQPPTSHQITRRSHETYRLLRRKNLILEAVRSLKIIEGFFPIQKIVNDDEKQSGVSSKCCRKTVERLVNSLSREGLLKIYTTTVIQDGTSKKLEMIVHPSVQPNDDIVNKVIEQVRFRISSFYSTASQRQVEQKAKEQAKQSEEKTASSSKAQKDKADKRRAGVKEDKSFKPTRVKGLGKSFGFQPKMHRLRIIHNFLYYLIYEHPLRHSSDPDTRNTDTDEKTLKDTESADNSASNSVEPQTKCKLDAVLTDEEEEQKDKISHEVMPSDVKVYAEEDTWKKFIPPVLVQKDYDRGWVMVRDLLLCLPLSIFVQVIQINYKVDGLEECLNDPVKQHYLVSVLPAGMRRQLFFKRKYLFSFYENLQRLVYMGLLQFGPVEKFKDRDQVFVFLKRKATIVDTTNAEPHYWLVTELPDKPFERRLYTLNSSEDVESYWFDLMCVCLNTPLGVIRSKRSVTEDEAAPSFVQERNIFVGLAYLLKGSSEVCDDGSIPGDGKGAGGLHSEFYAHLKRNWLWTSYLLCEKKTPSGLDAPETKVRLKSLLSKNALRFALKAGGTTLPRCLTTKQPGFVETVEVGLESASRNEQVVGGKKQKRKRSKKEVVRVQRKKKKEPKKRTLAHDEADHKALKMMTRQRVYWSLQEDSLMMLCYVAAQLLNSQLTRPFVPHCVVRDLLHTEFEISGDKTSLAVARRSRHILKNHQTLLNYRICIAEVYQDKTLLKVLKEKKPADPDKPEDCAEAFSEYIRQLRLKFSTFVTSHDTIMPDTKQELFSRFKVSTIDDGKTISCKDSVNCRDDIHGIVLHNLIQSTLAMTNSQMKSTRSFQTFHMYSKYKQEVLCQVFIKCRQRGLVNRRRVNQPFGPKKRRALPILPMSYQLSQSYYRCFSWRFPHLLCTDSFHILRKLINSGASDDRPVTMFYHETENRSLKEEELLERKRKGKKDVTPESNLEKANAKSAKERGNKVEGGEKLMEVDENRETMNASDDQQNPEVPASSSEQTDDALPPGEPSSAAPGGSEGPPDVSDMLQFSLDSPGGDCLASLSLLSLGLLSVYISIPKQMVVVDSNLVDYDVVKSMAALEDEDDDDYDGEDCERKKKLEVKAHQASHTKYLMMRGYCCPGIVKVRNLSTNDNIVVESCFIKLKLRATPSHDFFTENSPLDFTKCGPSLLPSILTYSIRSSFSPPSLEACNTHLIQQRGYTPQDIEACSQLRRSLDKAGEKGLDIRDLYEAHTHLKEPQSGRSRSLQQYMKDLQEEGHVLRVGGLSERWVLIQHAEPWLLSVNSKQHSNSRFTTKEPFLENLHSISLTRKRNRRGVHEESEETPAKKSAVDQQASEERESLEKSSETLGEEEQQQHQANEGNEDEAERGTQQTKEREEEDAGREKVETEGRQLRARKSRTDKEREMCSPPPGSADMDNEDNVSFISRPWRMVDGKMNRPVGKGMLEAVLYHIMSRPGLTQQTLVEHYKDVLQPMAVLDLVQALIDLGCVMKRTLVKAPKPSLFSRSVSQSRNETDVKIEEPDSVFYEPTISCCLRLGQVLPNERHWNQCVI